MQEYIKRISNFQFGINWTRIHNVINENMALVPIMKNGPTDVFYYFIYWWANGYCENALF